MRSLFSRRFSVVATVATALVMILPAGAISAPNDEDKALTVADVEFLGEVVFPTGETFGGTEIGGLSSITYDAERDLYYAISDDPASRGPARFYTLAIDLGGDTFDSTRVDVVAVTELRDRGGEPFVEMTLDLEGLT